MKAIIEKALNTENTESNLRICIEFAAIVNLILNAKDENVLRDVFKDPEIRKRTIHFTFGFGGGHMWVKQIIDGEPKQQVIFVEF